MRSLTACFHIEIVKRDITTENRIGSCLFRSEIQFGYQPNYAVHSVCVQSSFKGSNGEPSQHACKRIVVRLLRLHLSIGGGIDRRRVRGVRVEPVSNYTVGHSTPWCNETGPRNGGLRLLSRSIDWSNGLDGNVAQDGCAVHDTAVRQIISHGIVLRDAVVPECDIVPLPAPADHEIRPRHMGKQKRQ